jgi:hypothetical protein
MVAALRGLYMHHYKPALLYKCCRLFVATLSEASLAVWLRLGCTAVNVNAYAERSRS